MLIIGIFLMPILSNAQTGSEKFTLPSPNAASLGEYGEVPVSKFTGIPNIQVPIYEAKVGNRSLPISISYHGGGVKNAKMASSVGLGWTLNAGGAVIRTVRGESDESTYGFFETGYNLQQRVYTEEDINKDLILDIKNGVIDPQPDQFTFNFVGQTGKMVYSPESSSSGSFLTIPKRSLDIGYNVGTGGKITDWTITDESGTIYQFNVIEESMSWDRKNKNVGTLYPTAWYLSLITYPSGKEIQFNYTDELNFELQQNSITYRKKMEIEALTAWQADNPTLVESEMSNLSNSRYLEEIVTPSKRIVFETTQREDHGGALKYSSVKIFEKNGTLIKRINLHQDYFTALSNGCPSSQSLSQQSKRLRLDSLSVVGFQGNGRKVHKFDYISGQLPKRCSYATDHWGFFNGALQNDTNDDVLPAVSVLDKRFSSDGAMIERTGANKEPNFSKARIATLKRITYPTGGWTEFEYEPNTYGYIGSDSVSVFSEETASINVYAFNPDTVEPYGTSDFPAGVTETQTITVPYEQIVNVYGNIGPGQLQQADAGSIPYKKNYLAPPMHSTSNSGPSPSMPPVKRKILYESENNAEIYIEDSSGNRIFHKAFSSTCEDGLGEPTACPDQGYSEQILLLEGEQYTLTSIARGYEDDANVKFDYHDALSQQQKKTAGGLRIKKITSHDGMNQANDMIRTFYYHDEDYSNRSSGSIIAEPNYTTWVEIQGYPNTKWLFRYSTSSSVGGPMGSYVVYENVIERMGKNEDLGSIHQKFNSLQQQLAFFPLQEYAPFEPLPNYWRLGKPLKTEIYDGAGNLMQRKTSSYTVEAQEQVKYVYFQPLVSATHSDGSEMDVGYEKLNYRKTGWRYLSEKESTTFDTNGDQFTSTVQFFRDDLEHKQLTKKIKTNSDGQKRITKYKYAHEVSDDGRGNPYTQMSNLNMLTQPYSITVEDSSGFVLSKNWTLWNNNFGWWAPESKWVWSGGNPNDPEFTK